MRWRDVIGQYEAWGYQLIPLDPFAKAPESRGKKPRDNRWTTEQYSLPELLAWAMQGGLHNLGARLGTLDLVIDVDPRNGGEESFKRLKEELKENFSNCPIVHTGGGGLHVYLRSKEPLDSLPNEFTEYPGVEWKRAGRQVVAPNSTHPLTGKLYNWGNDVKRIPAPSKALLDLFSQFQYTAPASTEDLEAIRGETLEKVLSQLPIEQYDSNDRWFKVLAAAYHATGGTGLDEFIAWSTADPSYREHEKLIAARWRSLEKPTVNKRSLGTLIYELKKHKGSIPDILRQKHSACLEDFKTGATVEDVEASVKTLGEKSNAAQVTAVLRQIAQLDPLEQVDALADLQALTGRTKGSLSDAIRHIKQEGKKTKTEDTKMIDVPYDVGLQVLKECFDGGKTLVRALDGRYWRYVGTHWEPYSTDELKGLIKTKSEEYRDLNPAVKFQISSTIISAEVVIRAAVAKGTDLLGTKSAPAPVINCQNWELWVQEDGKIQKRKHSPDSFLTYCLPIDYDEGAKCGFFEETLRGIFSPLEDQGSVIRHLWEVYGYTIQPQKSIPSWFLFQGRGANGKSLILDVLMALLGPAARPVSSISELTSSRSEFALSECVGALAIIDDDVKKDTVLNDSTLKKISEDKLIRARFLHQNYFTFRNCAVTLLAANGWPQTRDFSDGMMRRAYGFPFMRQFAHDDNRKKRIIGAELSGILNKALEGLLRLRKRGAFDVPPSCKGVIEKWKTKSNQVLGYLSEHHEAGRWEGLKDFELLWEGYENWARENGVKRKYSKFNFLEALESYGIKKEKNGMRGKV